MKLLLFQRLKRKVFVFHLITLCLLVSCRKEKTQPVDPIIQNSISGLYKDGNYYWEKNDNNGYVFAYDDSAKVKVEYINGNQVELEFLTSSPYPVVKSYKLKLIDSIASGITFYKFYQTLDSSKTHFSNIFGEFRIYTVPYSQTILNLWYADATVTNGQYGPPGVSLRCINFKKLN